MNLTKLSFLIIWPLAQVAEAQSQPPTLEEYLNSMDHASVRFAGTIHYDSPNFVLRSNLGWFKVNVDTGREQREFIEEICVFSFSDAPQCAASGTATIEIDGSSIELSIDSFDMLKQSISD